MVGEGFLCCANGFRLRISEGGGLYIVASCTNKSSHMALSSKECECCCIVIYITGPGVAAY